MNIFVSHCTRKFDVKDYRIKNSKRFMRRLIFMESIIFVHNTIKFTRSTFQRLLKDGWG